MSFKNKFDKFLDRLEIKDKIPPSIPFLSKPPSVPSASKPTSSHSSPQPYWQANFSPDVPVNTNFQHELGDNGWGNNELENYVDSPQNSFHTPSNQLIIRAIAASDLPNNKYTSARLTSHQRLAKCSGYVVASLTPPSANGIWPAFWSLPAEPFQWPNEGEVDIFEAWNGERVNHCCMHWGHHNGEDWNKHRVVDLPLSNIHKQHTYGFAWQQPEHGEGGRCIWYIDGKAVMKAEKPAGMRRFEEWRVILNVAVGGNVCGGKVPSDGSYDLVVHDLRMTESPEGGWSQFERDWSKANEGHAQ
ncbi:concanavalin A-like lectin/glucanase [Tothia fuscella]|uniref:Concanavalin A-like lectin/glucanase n=1 Tax=Tothia fuscella TaxID=1048955 RepID=A0A9P4NF55_9PEZI|nr:concanavalin A-like lectin/glucanase [Tothia fuscella]